MKLLRFLIDTIRTRQLPMFAWSREGQTAKMKCPQCKALLELSIGEQGERAFECSSCGTRGIWKEAP